MEIRNSGSIELIIVSDVFNSKICPWTFVLMHTKPEVKIPWWFIGNCPDVDSKQDRRHHFQTNSAIYIQPNSGTTVVTSLSWPCTLLYIRDFTGRRNGSESLDYYG